MTTIADPNADDLPGDDLPRLTIVVPTFNERDNVALVHQRLGVVLAGIPFELIFVDDDSPDGTSEVVHALGVRDRRVRCITRVGRRGLAGACIEGILSARADLVAVMDADLQHDETVIPAMLERIVAGPHDIVIASRYLDAGIAESMSPVRRALSRIGGAIARRILRIAVTDPMSGFFLVRRSLVEDLAPRLATQGFKILADILVTGAGRIEAAEIPYRFGQRIHGESKLDELVLFDFLSLMATRATGNLVPIRFIAFILVGAFGLLVHLTILRLALGLLADRFMPAQVMATLGAMTVNFFLNNALTYRDQRLRGMAVVRGLLAFYAVCAFGAFNNVAVSLWFFDQHPVWWLAATIGALVGAVWNYALSTAFVWRAQR